MYVNNNTSSRGSEEERIGIPCYYEVYICIGKGKIMCDGMMPKIINKYHTRGKGWTLVQGTWKVSKSVGGVQFTSWSGQSGQQVGRAGQINKLVGWSVGWSVGCFPYSCTPSIVVTKKNITYIYISGYHTTLLLTLCKGLHINLFI